MAAPAIPRLTRRRYRIAAGFGIACGLLMFAIWAGSSIPRNADWREVTSGDYVVGLETNGVHTALVLPLVTPLKDWRESFPPARLGASDRPYTHISVSWGEREVFLGTPSWWDLSPRTVLRILTRGGEGLAHVAYYVRPATSDDLRPIKLSEAEYAALVEAIENSFSLVGTPRTHQGYGSSDLFYEVGGEYTAVNTCNQWTSDRLAEAGVRTGWWTPMAGGVMKWIRPPQGETALESVSERQASRPSP
ncbi:DUF2459 domain-containing protein [Novosphingobium sp. M1R2S20]|uniref:DUF2459 domain-containing protein n=1 Tax=Novosphingobium rhizovicinum TaxID=3228928 RepID=A0ABV3RED1_9SPHN